MGVWLTSRGDLSGGELLAFFATATVLRFPVDSIGFLLSMTFDARTATDRFFDILDTPNEITDPAVPVSLAAPRGRLAVTEVHFRYPDYTGGPPRPAGRHRSRARTGGDPGA